jgi:hypothetical protein
MMGTYAHFAKVNKIEPGSNSKIIKAFLKKRKSYLIRKVWLSVWSHTLI